MVLPRRQLALTPTPLLRLDRLSHRPGVEVYLERDDLTGLLESGSEMRKLEFLVAGIGALPALALTQASPRGAAWQRRRRRP